MVKIQIKISLLTFIAQGCNFARGSSIVSTVYRKNTALVRPCYTGDITVKPLFGGAQKSCLGTLNPNNSFISQSISMKFGRHLGLSIP